MDTSKTKVRVNIYGEEYSILADNDTEYVRKVAAYIDKLMRDIAEKLANKSPARVAVLAALNVADELFTEKVRGENLSNVERRANDIISFLDDKLSDAVVEEDQ